MVLALTTETIQRIQSFHPRSRLGALAKEALQFAESYLPADLTLDLLDALQSSVIMESALSVIVFREYKGDGTWARHEDWGVVSRKVVSTAGAGFIVDAFQGLVSLPTMRYHAIGTSSTAEATSQSGVLTETSSYTTGSRAIGTLEEPSSLVWRTSGTNQVNAGVTVTEHCVMNVASGAGVGFDRSMWGGTALSTDDAILTRYDLTVATGG